MMVPKRRKGEVLCLWYERLADTYADVAMSRKDLLKLLRTVSVESYIQAVKDY